MRNFYISDFTKYVEHWFLIKHDVKVICQYHYIKQIFEIMLANDFGCPCSFYDDVCVNLKPHLVNDAETYQTDSASIQLNGDGFISFYNEKFLLELAKQLFSASLYTGS